MYSLKPCPCGETPTKLYIDDGQTTCYKYASPNCCNEWIIEFSVRHYSNEDEIYQDAVHSWNSALRGFYNEL